VCVSFCASSSHGTVHVFRCACVCCVVMSFMCCIITHATYLESEIVYRDREAFSEDRSAACKGSLIITFTCVLIKTGDI